MMTQAEKQETIEAMVDEIESLRVENDDLQVENDKLRALAALAQRRRDYNREYARKRRSSA